MRPLFLGLSALLLASSAQAREPLPMLGTWVPAHARKALEGDEQRALGCYLSIERYGPLGVFEICEGEERAWPAPRLAPLGRGAMEILSVGDGPNEGVVERKLLYRAGTPDEIEATIKDESGRLRLRRLYRLAPEKLDAFQALSVAQGKLVGQWRVDDGAALGLESDGTYTFTGERGRYRLDAGFETWEGAWALLTLVPEDGRRRRYLVHGDGRRVGLAEVPQHLELNLSPPPPAPAEEDQAEVWPAGEGEAPLQGGGEVFIGGVAIPLPGAEPAGWEVIPAGVDEPEISLWITRKGEEEEAELPAEERAEETLEVEEELPPIAQPIVPNKRRACGCGAGEGGLALLGLIPAWAWYRARAREVR